MPPVSVVVLIALLLGSTTINYIDRQVLSVLAPVLRDEFRLSNQQYAGILNAFLITYAAGMPLAGWVLDRIGVGRGLTLAVGWWSVAGMLTSLARSPFSLGAFRSLLAIGESGAWPSFAKAVSIWVPPGWRTLAIGVCNSGSSLGSVIAPPVVVWVTRRYGWQGAFIVTGGLGLAWVLAFQVFRHFHPQMRLSDRGQQAEGGGTAPLRTLLRKRQMWIVFVCRFLADPIWYFYVFWIPEFLTRERGLSLAAIGAVAWIPFLVADISNFATGILAHRLERAGWSVNRTRKSLMLAGAAVAPVGVAAVHAQSLFWTMTFLCIAIFFWMIWSVTVQTLPGDYFPPEVVGSVYGFGGMGSTLGSVISTWAVGRTLDITHSYAPIFAALGVLMPVAFVAAMRLMGRVERVGLLAIAFLLVSVPPAARSQQLFASRCAGCHGEDGRGTAKGPALANNPRVAEQSTDELRAYLERGNSGAGMPSFSELGAEDLTALARYIRRLNADTILGPPTEPARRVAWGPPQPGDWPTYNGSDSGNRYSPLKEINTENVGELKLKWVFPIPYFGLETTPLAADGVLYVTGPNQVYAIDAMTGNPLWRYSRPPTPGMAGDAKLGTNRGVAMRGDKVFFVTDNARLLALDRGSGRPVWETAMAPDMGPEEHHHYGGTMAPLIVGDLVIAGVAGADEGIRGFVAAFRADTGALAWRRWTVPRKGEPGIETWQGKEPVTGGGSTWLTGSYDATSDTLYWATGNPWPDGDDRDRPGDNLYTNCVLALDPKTGSIKWHYQFTPHDVKDRDATEPNVLVDTEYGGKDARLLLHADRNGFFYVLDRTNGKVLLAKPFLRRVDWVLRIGADGRPVVADPRGCPSDAANWDSTAYSPRTRLYYVMALEECTGKPTGYPDQTGQRYLRAVGIDTGEIAWEVAQPGPARAKTWTGVLATAGGLVFYGQPNGGFSAVDERNGKTLWVFPTNVRMKAPPMTFTAGGKQFVAVAAGPNILCFGL